MNSREALVFLPVKAGNDRIARHEGGQGTTIQFVRKNPQIFRIGANIAFLKEDSPLLQEALGLDTRTATGFRVEMNLHAPLFPTSRLGSSRLEVCGMILGETLLMVGLGVTAGILCTYGVVAILHRTSPTLQVTVEGAWIVRAILLTIGGAIAGAAYPALRAAHSDPVDALAYE